MADVFLALLLLRALLRALVGRYAPAIVAVLLSTLLFLLLGFAGFYGRRADALGRAGVAMLIMLGPSALPGPAKGIPLSGLVGAYPLVSRAVLFGILATGFALSSRHAERVSPLSDEYKRRHGIALGLMAPAVVLFAQIAVTLCAESLSSLD